MKKINNHKFYKKVFDKYGVSARGVHWKSQETQYKRFEVLTSFIKEPISQVSIVDAGCGFGEYFNYLNLQNLHPKEYLGLDCEEHMVTICKERFDSKPSFLQRDIIKTSLPLKDYYICSGALNTLCLQDLKSFINNCYYASNKAFIFNYLNNESFVGISKAQLINICMELSSKIDFKDGYLHNDYTICLEK